MKKQIIAAITASAMLFASFTSAIAAQMIKNAITAPIVTDTHEYSYDAYGNRYAKLEQMDGKGAEFETLLIKNHDVYEVKGHMTGIGGFAIESSKNFYGEYYPENSNQMIDIETNYTADNADKNATAFIKATEKENIMIYMY